MITNDVSTCPKCGGDLKYYGMASVLDLYDLAGLTCQNYMADKYGWTDIQSARVARTRDGYILQLPRAIQIT